MFQDIRVAWRFLLKRRTTTTVAVLTLAIAVAVCTLALGLVDAAFWRPLAFDRERELVTVYNSRPAAPGFQALSYPDYTDLRDRLQGSLDLAAFARIQQTLAADDGPVHARGELVSPNYFEVLGAKPFAGELFAAGDGRASTATVVLSHDLWRRRFGADPAAIGRPIRLGRATYIVLGVAPPGFHGPAYPTEFWVLLAMTRQVVGGDYLSRADVPLCQTVGRLRDAVPEAQIRARVQGMSTFASRDGWRLEVFPVGYLKFWPAYRPAIARFLTVFVLLAASVLLIATANLAGLLIARADERRRELALRQALGASRLQLCRRLAAESLVLTTMGGLAGFLLAFWAASFIERVPVPVPAPLGITIDVRLGFIAAGLSLAASLLFTALSSWSAISGLWSVRQVLTTSAGTLAPRARAQRVVVVVQVALSCSLLILGGLLSKSAFNVAGIDIGFEPSADVIATVGLGDQGYTPTTGNLFYGRLLEELRAHPETEAASLGWHVPLAPLRVTSTFSLQGQSQAVQARYDVVGVDYFETLRIPIRGGREFGLRDSQASEPVAIVNESMAGRFTSDAIGQTIKLPGEQTPRRVVGIAGDVKYNTIVEPSQPFVYLPLMQAYRADMHVYLRTRSAQAEAMIRNAVRRLDSDVAVSDVRALEDQVSEARSVPRVSAIISGGAALVAVFLALVGVYGLLTTSVERRRRELAIRTALGAAPADIVRSVAIEGATLTFAGLMVGLLVSLATGRLVEQLLFEMGPYDGMVYGVVPLLVVAASVAAWIGPARRAARVDPVAVLRSE
jgi:putative ABC transport system permease protein